MSTATYSAEDNKLRLYVGRVPRHEYEELRAAGFVSTPKQDCNFVATWTPEREDLALGYLAENEDIGDEDYSPEERSADRAERFADYRDKRADEAGVSADTFQNGPQAFGHQNRDRAERQARRHDRHRVYAVSQWSKAEYWQQRTAAVISHALHRSSAAVRRSRILRLEAEQRKQEASINKSTALYNAFAKLPTMEGADSTCKDTPALPAFKLAYYIVNSSHVWGDYQHPRMPEDSRNRSLYSLLTDQENPITPREASALYLEGRRLPDDPASWSNRWREHYKNRLAYENAMLAEEGGTAAEADMEPGGWINADNHNRAYRFGGGWKQIEKVNKSPTTGRVVSVVVNGGKFMNIERLPEGAYRAPTEEERAAFLEATKQRKAEEKATKPKTPPLVNPTMEDALKLQALWNEKALAGIKDEWSRKQFVPSEVLAITQEQYSARSKGSYSSFETVEVSEKLLRMRRGQSYGRVAVFKIRKACPGGQCYSADRVIVLTDKPQKPIPWKEAEKIKATMPSEASVFPTLGKLVEFLGVYDARRSEECQRLLHDAAYVGWAYSASASQEGLTEAGCAAYQRFKGAPKICTACNHHWNDNGSTKGICPNCHRAMTSLTQEALQQETVPA